MPTKRSTAKSTSVAAPTLIPYGRICPLRAGTRSRRPAQQRLTMLARRGRVEPVADRVDGGVESMPGVAPVRV